MANTKALGRTIREVLTAWTEQAQIDANTIVGQYLPGPKHELQIQADGQAQLTIREEEGRFIGNRVATTAEQEEFFDALQKGQVEISLSNRLTGERAVLHSRTFEPLLTDDELYEYEAARGCEP